MEKKVLVPVAQGIEEMEAITIIDVLRRSGASFIVASVDEQFDLIALPRGISGAQNLRDSKELEMLYSKDQVKKVAQGLALVA